MGVWPLRLPDSISNSSCHFAAGVGIRDYGIRLVEAMNRFDGFLQLSSVYLHAHETVADELKMEFILKNLTLI